MSKNAQRARSLYDQGLYDASHWPYRRRWKRHRNLPEYERGFNYERLRQRSLHRRAMQKARIKSIGQKIKDFFKFKIFGRR